MSIKSRIIRGLLKWLWVRYPGQVKDIVLGPSAHVHKNPRKACSHPSESVTRDPNDRLYCGKCNHYVSPEQTGEAQP